ncbi:5106_t:CDS:1, partial [Funneliformis mosseae]
NQHFQENLEILKLKDSVRSLSIYDEYSDEEYQIFCLLSTKIEGAAYGFETFSGSFLDPLK